MKHTVLFSRVFGLCLFFAILALPSVALASITFTVNSPVANQAYGSPLVVSVGVTSTYALTSVSAQTGSVSASLTAPSSAGQPWTGSLDISSLPIGATTVTITAIDALSDTVSTTVPYVHHNPPTFQITSPLSASVIQSGMATISATCSDDLGCLQPDSLQPGFVLQVGDATIYRTSTGSMNQSIDLSAYEGTSVTLTFLATDSDEMATSAGQPSTQVSVVVYVDSSTRLVEADSVPGTLLDFDSTRLLYAAPDNSVVVRNRQTQAETVIGTSVGGAVAQSASLTSVGAVWTSNDSNVECGWYWNGGTATQFGGANCEFFGGGAVIAGDWALAGEVASVAGSPLSLQTLNLATGATINHSYGSAFAASDLAGATIAPDGELFFVMAGDSMDSVYRDDGGAADMIGMMDAPGSGSALLTDGINLVTGVVIPGNGYWLDQFSIAGGSQSIIAAAPTNSSSQIQVPPTAGTEYQVNNGWTAYVTTSNTGVNQVWTRSPTGSATEISVFDTNSTIDTLGPTGQVTFENDGNADAGVAPGRYLGLPPQRISSALGRSVSSCDGWYVIIGSELLRVTDTEDAGTGCPAIDAGGVIDAGGTKQDGGLVDASTSDGVDASTGGAGGGDAAGGGSIDGSLTDGPVVVNEAGPGATDATALADAHNAVDGSQSVNNAADAAAGNGASGAEDASETGAGGGASGGGGGGCAVAFGGGDGASPWPMAIIGLGLMVSARRIRRRRSLGR